MGILILFFWLLMNPIARFGVCEDGKESNALEDGIFKIERKNLNKFYDGCIAAASGDATAQYALGRYYLLLQYETNEDSNKRKAIYWGKKCGE